MNWVTLYWLSGSASRSFVFAALMLTGTRPETQVAFFPAELLGFRCLNPLAAYVRSVGVVVTQLKAIRTRSMSCILRYESNVFGETEDN